MVQFLSIIFFFGFLQFLLGYSKVPVFLCHPVHTNVSDTVWLWAGTSQSAQRLATAGRSRDRIPVRARFSAPFQTGTGFHPASYTMGTGSCPWVKRPGRGVDHPPHLAPRLKKEQSFTSTPPLGLRGLLQGEHYLHLYCLVTFVMCW